MHRFFQMVTRRAIPLLIAILGITVFLSLQLPKLRIDTSVMRMLVEDLPAKRDYDRYRAEFGRVSDDIVVVFKAKSVFSQDAFDKISKLTESLKAVPGVKGVVSLSSLKDDLDILNEWTLKDLKRNVNLADVFINNFVSADGKAAAIVVLLQDDYSIEETTQGIEAVLDQFRGSDDPLSVYQIGTPVVGHALTEYTLKDFRTLPLFTMAMIFLVLLFCFRSLRGALVPFTAVCITLVWTFGLMGLMGSTLSMVTMIIPTLLIAVGSAYALHIMAAYFDEAAREEAHEEAVIQGLKRVCLPTVVASATTIVGFASLLTNKIDIVQEFALFSCLGLFIMLVIHLVFIPAALSRLQMPKTTSVFDPLTKSWIETLLGRITLITRRHPVAILLFSAVTALAAGAGVFRIQVETSPISYFKSQAPVKMAFEDVHKHLAGIYPINVILRTGVPGYFTSPKILQQVETLQKFLSGIKGVDVTVSVVDLLKFEGLFTRGFREKEKYYTLPNDAFVVREAIKNFRMLRGDEFLDYFVSKDFSRVNVTCRSHMVSTAEFIRTENIILEYVRKHFPRDVEVDVTGLTMAVSHSSDTVTRGQVKSLGLALMCIFMLLSVLFLSPKVGLYAMMPNFFPIIVNFGVMGWLGIHLSVATSLIASIAIGLSVDDTIHYVFRFNQELKKDLSRRQAMARTTAAVGKPIVFTSLTIGLGFSVLLFSSFVPTMVFGFLMLVTIASALVGDLFILAAILLKIQLVTLWDLLRLKLGKDPREGIRLFDGLSRSQVHYILMAGSLKGYANGDILFRKGDVSDSMYAVISGHLEVFDDVDSDDKGIHLTGKLISTLGTGDVVGEMGMVRHCQRSATVLVKERAELLEINEKMIRRLQWLFPPTAQKFFFNLMTMICNRLEDTTKCLAGLTTLDGVTGLHDRAYFETTLGMEIVRARRYDMPLSILLVAFDRFQEPEASSDREARRRVLAEVGRILKSNLRGSDTPCRFGAYHFAIVLPNSGEENARRACNRLRKILQRQPFEAGSMGFAVLNPDLKESAADLIAKALRALQRAEEQGGNRIAGGI